MRFGIGGSCRWWTKTQKRSEHTTTNYHCHRKSQGTFPENRFLAEKRLQDLQKRFIKNPDFFSDYKGIIEEVISKAYASMSNKEAPVDRTRCISHHGVYHPNNQGKSV